MRCIEIFDGSYQYIQLKYSFPDVNKGHQRIMVDPMFMIVQTVRSFLTAATPTAVTPTA